MTSKKIDELKGGLQIPKLAPRTVVDEEKARAFVEGRSMMQWQSRKRAPSGGERITVYLRPELIKKLRVEAAERGCSLSYLVDEKVAMGMQGGGNGQTKAAVMADIMGLLAGYMRS